MRPRPRHHPFLEHNGLRKRISGLLAGRGTDGSDLAETGRAIREAVLDGEFQPKLAGAISEA